MKTLAVVVLLASASVASAADAQTYTRASYRTHALLIERRVAYIDPSAFTYCGGTDRESLVCALGN